MIVHLMFPQDDRLHEIHPITEGRESFIEMSALPRKDETVLFITHDGSEIEYVVKHVIHGIEADGAKFVQVVLK